MTVPKTLHSLPRASEGEQLFSPGQTSPNELVQCSEITDGRHGDQAIVSNVRTASDNAGSASCLRAAASQRKPATQRLPNQTRPQGQVGGTVQGNFCISAAPGWKTDQSTCSSVIYVGNLRVGTTIKALRKHLTSKV